MGYGRELFARKVGRTRVLSEDSVMSEGMIRDA